MSTSRSFRSFADDRERHSDSDTEHMSSTPPRLEGIPETPPSTQASGATRAIEDADDDWPTDSEGRYIFAKDDSGALLEPPKVSKYNTQAFRSIRNPGGFTWKLTPIAIQMTFFEEFKKHFWWPEDWERDVYKFWLDKARRRYSSMMSEEKKSWKKNMDKNCPKYMDEDFWRELKEYWVREDVEKISNQNSINRLSEPDGPGTGISKHCGGSRSTRRLVQKMALKTGLPHRALNYESFRRHHIKADGTYLTERDQKLDVQIHEIARRDGREDLNEIFLEITRPNKSRRYGTGSFGSSQLSGGGSTRSTASSTSELTQSLFQARIGTLEEQLAQEKEARAQQAEEDRQARARLEQQAEEERQARQRLEAQFAEFRQMFSSGQFSTHPPPPPPL